MNSIDTVTAIGVVAACLVALPYPIVHAQSMAVVPLVGCKSDGQMGPRNAPTGSAKEIQAPPAFANRLAYYQAENGPGVLGPRGWTCVGVYGSNGETLYVTPDQLDSAIVLSPTWDGFSGPAIQISKDMAGTSGRFRAARIAARVFPAEQQFVQAVINEKIDSVADLPTGPYPMDQLHYMSDRIVEYQTPPGVTGLGTDSRLRVGLERIYGAAIFDHSDPALITLAVRLPQNLQDLVPMMVQQMIVENSPAN